MVSEVTSFYRFAMEVGILDPKGAEKARRRSRV
jgi:hypothetical protein